MGTNSYYRILLMCCIGLSACLKKEYTAVAGSTAAASEIPVQKSIAELSKLIGNSGTTAISESIVISGIVIADDRSGNFYKQIIIDDGTAAMPILLDAYSLYNDYPVGRKINVYCKGLYAAYYYKLPRLGYRPDSHGNLSGVPAALFDQFISKGSYHNKVQPVLVTAADAARFQSELLNRLIQLEDVQRTDTSALSYALSPALSAATNFRIMDCDSHMITIRTSGYCSFQAVQVPKGKGRLRAIYTVYNNTPQLILRDTADVQLYTPRCP